MNKKLLRLARKARIRKKIKGTKQRPRITIYKSNRYIYAQIIDDDAGQTLVSANTFALGKDEGEISKRKGMTVAGELGGIIGRKAVEKGIKTLVLDRNGYKYHGVVKVLTDAVRSAGLNI